MKKSWMIFAFVLLFIPLVFSIQINTESELNSGETFVVGFSGEFYKPILENNIYFYRNIYTAVPLEFELLKIEGEYYISASTLGKTPGNYSLVIKNSEYSIAGGQKSFEDIIINFTILDEFAEFSAVPGVQILENSRNPFYLEIQNLKDAQITISVDKTPSVNQEEQGGFFGSLFGSNKDTSAEAQFIFKTNEKKQIELEFENLTEIGLRTIKLSSGNFTQNVFVHVLFSEEKLESEKIYFEQEFFNISIATSSNTERILYLKNSGAKDFENVTLIIPDSLKEYVSVSPDFFEFFESNETQKIILNISSKSNSETISDAIKAQTSDNAFAYVDISLEIIEGFVPEGNITQPAILETCVEKNGTICKVGKEICSGSKIKTSDSDSCCLAKCNEKKKSSAGKIIGWGIVIILVALYVWFYLSKYKKTKSKVNLLEIAEGKSQRK